MRLLKLMVASSLAILAVLSSCKQATQTAQEPLVIETITPERPAGQTDVLQLACDPIETLRVGFIGLGNRGPDAVSRFTHIEGVEIVALCDVRPERVAFTQEILKKAGFPEAADYSSSAEAWKELCERDDIDLVYICTDWATHVPISVYAMEHGKHVACEVPATTSLEECWDLVNTAEKTRRHFMMLENCCYDFYEMATLNMAQQGLLGELVHVEGAYIHDLRWMCLTDSVYYENWRLEHNAVHDGNPYATHGLGPVSQALNIHRGDRMEYLVSLSSDQVGMTAYAEKVYGKDSPQAKREYKKGDMNTTLIKTVNGKSILIQHDITSPRPYNRKHSFSGTLGYIEKYPRPGIALEKDSPVAEVIEIERPHGAHSFLNQGDYEEVMAYYEHPITKEIGEIARKVGGHGGMDFIMDYRLVYCLRNGLPLDMDVYDAAEWSCIGELTELSVDNNSAPVLIPDFTRGAWNKVKGYKHAMK